MVNRELCWGVASFLGQGWLVTPAFAILLFYLVWLGSKMEMPVHGFERGHQTTCRQREGPGLHVLPKIRLFGSFPEVGMRARVEVSVCHREEDSTGLC